MSAAPLRLTLGFDQLEPVTGRHVLLASEDLAPPWSYRNLGPDLTTEPHFTRYLIANRRRLGLEIRLAPTERAARLTGPFFYELAIHNDQASEVHFAPGAGFWPRLPPEVRTTLQSGAARLLVTSVLEADGRANIEGLYRYLETVPLPPARVCYCCAASDLHEIHEAYCAERGVVDRLHVIGCHYWEDHTFREFAATGGEYWLEGERAIPLAEFAAAVFASAPWQVPYLSLNGKGRPHRWALLGLLQHRGLLQRGLVSYAAKHFEPPPWWPSGTLGEEARAGAVELETRLPLRLDVPPPTGSLPRFPSHLYLRTCLSLVAETFYAVQPEVLASEKVFRPILHLHPFLVVGPLGLLGTLRRAGYVTFAPLIDEAYDEMTDPSARLAAVVRELTRLCALSEDDLRAWHRRLRDRLEHNLGRLLSQRSRPADFLDRRLVETLAAMRDPAPARPTLTAAADGRSPAPARLLRLANLPAAWRGAPRARADMREVARAVTARLWALSPSDFEHLDLEPASVLLVDDAVVIEFAYRGAPVRVRVMRDDRAPDAVTRTPHLSIGCSGDLPPGVRLSLVDDLAASLWELDFKAVLAKCTDGGDDRGLADAPPRRPPRGGGAPPTVSPP
jgi:hypothetical protein